MQHQLSNQEVARLRYAEALREASRRPIVEKLDKEPAHRTLRLVVWARALVARAPQQVPAIRPRPS